MTRLSVYAAHWTLQVLKYQSVMELKLQTIATIRTPFRQKFAIPRQPNLVPEAEGRIVFAPGYADANSLRGLDDFSHLWLLFVFHEVIGRGWTPTVQPPRLGGRERVGVFATRSPFRPNPIGLSVVRNLGYQFNQGQLELRVGGVDLLDNTPILDIKPYLPYADALADANSGFAEQAPGHSRPLIFSAAAEESLSALADDGASLRALIRSVLRQDPRPAWRVKDNDQKQYGMNLNDYNIKWRLEDEGIVVSEIAPVAE